MTIPVKTPRRYYSPLRTEQAATTRHLVLEAAWNLFTTRGYAATSVTEVARAAGVSVDTLYATVGRKPVLLREVVESAISGTDRAIPADERDYVAAVRAADGAIAKIRVYAEAVVKMSPRTAPVFIALRDAARSDPGCAALDDEIASRRASNMLLFAADLRASGDLRAEISNQFIADVVWATAGAAHYAQFTSGRGWNANQFGEYLCELWTRMFLP